MAKKNNGDNPNDELATRLLSALSHPVRRRIVSTLAQEPASATMLADAFGIPLGDACYHLCEVLSKKYDVVQIVERNPRRGSTEKVFALKPEAFVAAVDWSTIPEPMRSGLRGLGLSRFLEAAVAALEAEGEAPKEASVYAYRPISVDVDGQREIGEEIEKFTGKVKAIEDRCAGVNRSDLLHLIIGTAAFESSLFLGKRHT